MDPWAQLSTNHMEETSELFLKHRQERWELRQEEYLREKALTNSQKEVAWCVPPTPPREDLCDDEIEDALRQEQDEWFIDMIREAPMKRRRLTQQEKERIDRVGRRREEEEFVRISRMPMDCDTWVRPDPKGKGKENKKQN